MSKPKKQAKKSNPEVKSLLSKTTIAFIGKGRAARYEVAVRSAIDCYKAVGEKLSVVVVRKEIKEYDPYYSLSKDVMQRLVNEVKGGNLDVAALVTVAEAAQAAANAAKAKSRGKTTGKAKGAGKAKAKSGLTLPDPTSYGDYDQLAIDYQLVVEWLDVAEVTLKKRDK